MELVDGWYLPTERVRQVYAIGDLRPRADVTARPPSTPRGRGRHAAPVHGDHTVRGVRPGQRHVAVDRAAGHHGRRPGGRGRPLAGGNPGRHRGKSDAVVPPRRSLRATSRVLRLPSAPNCSTIGPRWPANRATTACSTDWWAITRCSHRTTTSALGRWRCLSDWNSTPAV